ncbi:DUF1569 domain-containing protein [Psychroserpens luteus]|uniref:DUF1569 domain-containing protein n=1 Tax=Psychroserpens luteus TaxID=1434066 RepID=A0ABW5ZUS4_9FLAO|nr:DUF1569 domain-containing protein [Psychroserpens luteus]
MTNIFDQKETETVINRINNLRVETKPKWGKMSIDQMLAHCNVAYEMVYEDIHPKPKGLKKMLVKLLIKPFVTNEKPYKKNGQTAPQFLVKDSKNFELEKERLINYLEKTQSLGESHFDNKESHSFGKLTTNEWNNLFYKHINHHLNQFGV